MSLGMDSLPEPTECQGQRDHYVTGSFWWLWSLTGELVDGFAVSITQSLFKRNLKRAEALAASRFMTGHCWRDLPIHSSKHFWVACSAQGHEGKQSSPRIFSPPKQLSPDTPTGIQDPQALLSPAGRRSIYSVSWVCPAVSSQLVMQGIPSKGRGILTTSSNQEGATAWCRDCPELFKSLLYLVKWNQFLSLLFTTQSW